MITSLTVVLKNEAITLYGCCLNFFFSESEVVTSFNSEKNSFMLKMAVVILLSFD